MSERDIVERLDETVRICRSPSLLEAGPGLLRPIGDEAEEAAAEIRRLRSLLQGEKVEGWIDHDEAPEAGRWVAFWNHPVRRADKSCRATLILHRHRRGSR